MPPDRRPREGRGNEHWLWAEAAPRSMDHLRQVHLLVDRPHQDQRPVLPDHRPHGLVVGLLPRDPRHRKGTRKPEVFLKEQPDPPGIGLVRDDPERCRRKEILRHAPPQIPQGLQRRMLLARNERLGVQTQHLSQSPQERRRRIHPDRRLQIRLAQNLAQPPPELAIEADVGVRIHQVPHLGHMGAKRHHHVDLGPDPLDQTADLVQVRRHVEGAVHGPKDVDAGLLALGTRLLGRHPALGHPELGEDPGHRPVGGLPLVLVDGARQEALDVRPHRGHATPDHFGNRPRDDHRRQRRVERLPRPPHRPFGPVASQLFLAQTGDHDGQLMRRQRVGVVQDGRDRQVLAAHGAVDDNLQALHRTEGIDRPPVPASPVMVLDQHDRPPNVRTQGRRKEDVRKIISSPPPWPPSPPCRASSDAPRGSPAAGSARLPRCPPYPPRPPPRRRRACRPSGPCPR